MLHCGGACLGEGADESIYTWILVLFIILGRIHFTDVCRLV